MRTHLWINFVEWVIRGRVGVERFNFGVPRVSWKTINVPKVPQNFWISDNSFYSSFDAFQQNYTKPFANRLLIRLCLKAQSNFNWIFLEFSTTNQKKLFSAKSPRLHIINLKLVWPWAFFHIDFLIWISTKFLSFFRRENLYNGSCSNSANLNKRKHINIIVSFQEISLRLFLRVLLRVGDCCIHPIWIHEYFFQKIYAGKKVQKTFENA